MWLRQILTLAAAISVTGVAHASHKASPLGCSFTRMSQEIVNQDSLQNRDLLQTRFVQNGQSVFQIAISMGAASAKVTDWVACPSPWPGASKERIGGPLSVFSCARDAQGIKDAEAGCEADGGTWKKGLKA
jgi:hypothetical protein